MFNFPNTDPHPRADQDCPACNGQGWVTESVSYPGQAVHDVNAASGLSLAGGYSATRPVPCKCLRKIPADSAKTEPACR